MFSCWFWERSISRKNELSIYKSKWLFSVQHSIDWKWKNSEWMTKLFHNKEIIVDKDNTFTIANSANKTWRSPGGKRCIQKELAECVRNEGQNYLFIFAWKLMLSSRSVQEFYRQSHKTDTPSRFHSVLNLSQVGRSSNIKTYKYILQLFETLLFFIHSLIRIFGMQTEYSLCGYGMQYTGNVFSVIRLSTIRTKFITRLG